MSVKVSVIVPVYNVAGMLKRTLDSISKQTLTDIEVICVDDGSTDNSKPIIQEYMASDNRITGIFLEKNCGTSEARKRGVACSVGKYVMFLDGDDEFMPDACRIAYEAIEDSCTDMVQFRTKINNVMNYSRQQFVNMQSWLEPYLEKLENADIIRACWKEKKFSFTLWNKIYRGDICRTAFSKIEEGRFPRAEDSYAYFLIAYFAKSYAGIKDELYMYNWDNGVLNGSRLINLDTFEKYLLEKKVYLALERFLQQNSEDPYSDILEILYGKFLRDAVVRWKNFIRAEDDQQGFIRMTDVWGLRDVLCNMSENFWNSRELLCKKAARLDAFRYRKRDDACKMTLAVYYNFDKSEYDGQIVELCHLWKQLIGSDGSPLYTLVIISDASSAVYSENISSDFPIEYLPDKNESVSVQYPKRLDKWQHIIENRKIDIVIYADKQDEVFFWDMLSIKGSTSKPGLILYEHSCCLSYGPLNKGSLEQIQCVHFADAVVTNSKANHVFVEAFAQYAAYIPFYVSPDALKNKNGVYETNVLLWSGAITTNKHCNELIKTMRYIAKEVPQVKLYITGYLAETIKSYLTRLINQGHLTENVLVLQDEKAREHINEHASILLCTDERDADTIFFIKSLLHGIPIVSYSVPWLPFAHEGGGVLQVERYQYEILAEKVIWLLKNPPEIEHLRNDGKTFIKGLFSATTEAVWSRFFETVNDKTKMNLELYQQNVKNMLSYMIRSQDEEKKTAVRFEREAAAKLQKELNKAKKESNKIQKELDKAKKELDKTQQKLDKAKKELDKTQKEKMSATNKYSAILTSWSYRIGRKITFLPRLIKTHLL